MSCAKLFSRRSQQGAYVIWVLVLIPVLAGALAFVFDVGLAFATHERAKTAADAAALAAAMAAKRESDNLNSPDNTIKDKAVKRVEAAAIEAAGGKNEFTHDGDKVTITVEYPPTTTIYSPYNVSPTNLEYVGVTVSKKINILFAYDFIFGELPPVSAYAIAKVGAGGLSGSPNSCPGIYAYGKDEKNVTDLKGKSDLKVLNGGIFLNSDGKVALYGSAGSTMTAEWIEVGKEGKAAKSVDYYCDKYPSGSPSCVEPVSEAREPPDLDLSSTPCTASNSNCVIDKSSFKCDCSEDKKKGITCTTGELPLQAGRYCGLKIQNSGTSKSPLILGPSATTNIWDLRGTDGLEIINSVVTGVKDSTYDGVVLFSSDGALTMGTNKKDTKSTLNGSVRLYFNSIDMDDDSLIEINSFDEDGCGKKKDDVVKSVLVQ